MKRTVLIADGDTEYCDLVEMYLGEIGFQVETASNALDCLMTLRREAPAVLVLDLELRWGGSDGILAWLRENRHLSAVSVIVTASTGYPLDASEVRESPIVDYLSKPFTPDALLECIDSAMANQELHFQLSPA